MPNVCVGENCQQKTIKLFWREGCGWCEKVKPIIEEMKSEHPEITFEVIDDTPLFKAGKGLQSYPSVLGFDEHGQEMKRKSPIIANQDKSVNVPATKKNILSCLQNKTIADFSVMELVLLRDQHIADLQSIQQELLKRK